MAEAFYEPLGAGRVDEVEVESFLATAATSSPWGTDLQHGGPVCGLLTRAMDRGARPESRLTRVTVELLGPVPVGRVHVRSWIERPGRNVELVASQMLAAGPDGRPRPVALARAWRLATDDTHAVERRIEPVFGRPGPDEADAFEYPSTWGPSGFLDSTDWILVDPGGEPGHPTGTWIRLGVPLVAGESTSPLEAAVTIADCANGVGARLDPRTHAFLNTETTIHLPQRPAGEWFGMRAELGIGADGVGLTSAVLYSDEGPIGRIAQNVLVQRR